MLQLLTSQTSAIEDILEIHTVSKSPSFYYKTMLNDQEVKFKEIPTSAQGDCGFEALGIERKKAIPLLLNASEDTIMRGLLRNEIKAAFYQGELANIFTVHLHQVRVKEFFDIYENIQNNYIEQEKLDSLLDSFCLEKEIFEDYVWQQGQDDSLIPVHRALYGNNQAEENIHMLHTYASEDGKIRNHFTSLKVVDPIEQNQSLDNTDKSKNTLCSSMLVTLKGVGKRVKNVGIEIKEVGKRIVKSNNRSLGTLFGCMAGFTVGTLLVTEGIGGLPLVGDPSLLSVPYKIVGVLLGTGGNLSSYIGASIDIITNEKTVFDLINLGYQNTCGNKFVTSFIRKRHYPFITSEKLPLKEPK